MDDFDPYRNDDAISYAVKTGDLSRGASPRDLPATVDAEFDLAEDWRGRSFSRLEAIATLGLALAFLIVAALSF